MTFPPHVSPNIFRELYFVIVWKTWFTVYCYCMWKKMNHMHILPKEVQNVWKMSANPWKNQMIWPIPTSKALFLGNIPSMHNVKITLQIIVTSKFRLNSLPLLAWSRRSRKHRWTSVRHCSQVMHWSLN